MGCLAFSIVDARNYVLRETREGSRFRVVRESSRFIRRTRSEYQKEAVTVGDCHWKDTGLVSRCDKNPRISLVEAVAAFARIEPPRKQFRSEVTRFVRDGIHVVPTRVQGLMDVADIRELRDVHNGGRPIDGTECIRAQPTIVARLRDGVENSVEDRNVPMTKREPETQRTCWHHCGIVEYVVAQSPSRGNVVSKRVGGRPKLRSIQGVRSTKPKALEWKRWSRTESIDAETSDQALRKTTSLYSADEDDNAFEV